MEREPIVSQVPACMLPGMTDPHLAEVRPAEGVAVMHLFYRVNHPLWREMPSAQRDEHKEGLLKLAEEAARWEKFRLYTFAMLAHADIGFMILGPDIHRLNWLEKRLGQGLGPDVLEPVYTFWSLTERSEYTTTPEEHAQELEQSEGIKPGTPEFEEKLRIFRERIEKYTYWRLYPEMPEWEYFCFYPMRKRREAGQNWYALDFAERKRLMSGHARVGRRYAEKVKQLITGCTGLDDWEWGVSLFAHTPSSIKEIVYEMRFDEVSHTYAEFGPFFNGLTLPLPRIFERLDL